MRNFSFSLSLSLQWELFCAHALFSYSECVQCELSEQLVIWILRIYTPICLSGYTLLEINAYAVIEIMYYIFVVVVFFGKWISFLEFLEFAFISDVNELMQWWLVEFPAWTCQATMFRCTTDKNMPRYAICNFHFFSFSIFYFQINSENLHTFLDNHEKQLLFGVNHHIHSE